jgi:hypothetical protein
MSTNLPWDARGEREILMLEQKAAETADPARAAPCYNAAGDLSQLGGDHVRAVRYFGLSIDRYLEAGLYSAANVVTRKLLELAPDTVRARCTLAWLAIGRGLLAASERELSDYVAAARKAGQEQLAIRHLRMMGEVVTDPDLRYFLADRLLELRDELGARAVAGLADEAAPPQQARTAEDRWERVLRAALAAPDDVRGMPTAPPGD